MKTKRNTQPSYRLPGDSSKVKIRTAINKVAAEIAASTGNEKRSDQLVIDTINNSKTGWLTANQIAQELSLTTITVEYILKSKLTLISFTPLSLRALGGAT